MAGGKIGDLWWELGLRDKSSKELNKVLKEVQKLDGMINKINKEISEGDDSKKKALTNALSYLRMLQQIANEERKIKDLKRLSAGVDTSELNKALKLLSDFRRQLIDLQSGGAKGGGGVDNAFISGFQKAFGNTLADVKEIERVFKSDNSLSVFRNNASRLTNELEKVKNRLAEIYSMQSKGMKNGWDTSMLLGAGNSLRGVKKRIESILRDNSRLGSESEVKKLLSDIQIAYTKVRGKVAEYNREKQKSIELERKHKAVIDSNNTAVARLVRGFESANRHAGSIRGPLNDIKNLLLQGGIVYGMHQFMMSIIQTGGEMEKQHIALQSILGDLQNANRLYGQAQELALNSPFTFSELNKDVKQLAAYGVEYDQLYDTTKRLADMASGLGVSFDRIALAFGQVQARGWLDGKELRQIAYAGIPLLEKLSEYYSKREGKTVTTSDVKTMISKREVDFEDMKNIFWEMTDAGGEFYNMQLVLSETLLGRYNKLKDAWEIMLADFARGGSAVGGTLKSILDIVTYLVQNMHMLAPAVLGAFSSVAITRAGKFLAGSGASGFLSNKAKLAEEYKAKAIAGKELSAVERSILATKNKITMQDLEHLAAAQAITKTELQRLYVSGKITQEQYKQTMTLLGMNTFWTNFANKGTVTFALIGKSIAGFGKSLFAAFGGWPGIIFSAVMSVVGYIYSVRQELKQSIEQTQDEIKDRVKQLTEFIRDNNPFKAISGGDDKEIDNMISSYKEKLKELAPYDYSNILMKAAEKNSHEERLRYLSEEIKLLKEAKNISSDKLEDDSYYKSLRSSVESASNVFKDLDKLAAERISNGMSKEDAFKDTYERNIGWKKYIDRLRTQIYKEFGDISKDPKMRYAANQALSSMFTNLKIDDDTSNHIRAALMQSFGIVDGWLSDRIGDAMRDSLDKFEPVIAAKIRAGSKLEDAERDKVKMIMADVRKNLKNEMPYVADVIQKFLNDQNFTAVINVVVGDSKQNSVYRTMADRFPSESSLFSKEMKTKYARFTNKWSKGGTWKDARDAAKADINAAEEEYKNALKSDSSDAEKLKQEWLETKQIAETLLHGSFDDEKKKNGGGSGGSKTDKLLDKLRNRLQAFKNARQTYQKYKTVMGEGAAKSAVSALYPEISGLDLNDYEGSIREMLKGFDGNLTEDRRKFISDTNKEIAEWRFSEIMKPEFERLRQDFTEALEEGARQADLYEALFAKTGDKDFAMNAFAGGMLWDDLSSGLADEFRQMTGKEITQFLDQSDAVVKKNLVTDMGLPDAYELWKKISGIVKDNYKKYLEDAAEVIKSTANWEEKIAQARSKYASRIRMVNQAGDAETARRYTQQMEQEVSRIRSEKFEQSQDYLNFFGSIITMGAERAMALVPEIIENLNRKLKDGSISAREYAKQMKQVDEQMAKLRVPRRTFLNSGIEGVAQRNIDEGYEKISKGATDKQKADEMMREGIIKGDAELQAAAVALKAAADKLIEAGKTQMSIGENLKKSFSSLEGAFNYVDNVWGGVSGAFNQFKGMADSLGIDTSKGGWAKASTYIDSIGSITGGASSAIRSVFKGDLGGIVTGAASVITGPITTFAKAHDARKEREIRLAQEQIDILQGIKSNVSNIIERALGGAYNYKRSESTQRTLNDVIKRYGNQTIWEKAGGKHYYSDKTYEAATNALGNMSAYNDQLAAMYAQRDLIQHQRDSEDAKKKKDSSKIRDYNDKLEEMDNSIKDFSQDFLKSIYNVDFKSWASQLTDAVVGAWEKGEDAVEAYHDKAKSLVGDLTKNIITQNIMERALQPALDYLTQELENKNGLLDASSIVGLGKLLEEAGDKSIANITSVLELLKKNGWDLSADSSGSTSNSVKTITEDTGGLIASYLNSIRLDVSVNRDNIQLIADSMQSLTDMNIISKSQLSSLNQLVDLAVYRNGVLDDMYGWMRKVSMGTEMVCVK